MNFNFSNEENPLEPPCRTWLRQRFAGQFLITLRGVIYKCGYDGGDLFQIVFPQVIIRVHIRMVGTGVVFYFVLDKLKSRQADRIEGQMVGAACIIDSDGGGAEVMERRSAVCNKGSSWLHKISPVPNPFRNHPQGSRAASVSPHCVSCCLA